MHGSASTQKRPPTINRMNYHIGMDSTIARSMNGYINMDSIIARSKNVRN